MTSIFQSAFASLLGLALCVLGVVHSVGRYPGPQTFNALAAQLPAIGAALFFALGLAAAAGGAAMLWVSTRRLARHWRHLQQLAGTRRHGVNGVSGHDRFHGHNGRYAEDDEREYAGSYR